jgi:hypothetical protein
MFYAPVSDFTDLHRAAQRGDEAEVRRLLQQVGQKPCPPVSLTYCFIRFCCDDSTYANS